MRAAFASVLTWSLLGCGQPPAAATSRPFLDTKRMDAILAAPATSDPVFSPDGNHVLYLSTMGGASLYLHDLAHPGGTPRALVRNDERVGSAMFTPDGASVLFRQDHGADENFHIFRIGIDGEGLVDLTPGPAMWRDHPFVARQQPDRMVYSARHTDDYTSMIHVQPLAGSVAAREVYRDAAPATVVDLAPDGKRALMLREAASGKQLIEVELESGMARQIAPKPGDIAMIQAAAFASDGRRVFIARDRGPEGYVLVALDLRTLETLATYWPEGAAAVGAVVPSPRGDRVAITVDQGNHSSLRILDAVALTALADVATPLGTVTLGTTTELQLPMAAGTFANDGRQLVFGVSAPDTPGDVYRLDPASGVRMRIGPDSHAATQLAGIDVSIQEMIAFDGLKIPMNVYLPRWRSREQRLPTIVFFHGGPDQKSSLAWNPLTSVMTASGFAVVEPNIRGSAGFGRAFEMADDKEKRGDALRDVQSVNDWLRRQAWCDPDRLVIEGASYGGYLVLMALTQQAKLWRAGVDLAGPSDLTTMLRSDATPRRYLGEFGDVERDAALLRQWSPLHQVSTIVTPLFVYQGENDPRVPRAQADAIVQALRARNIPVEYMVGAGEGHTLDRHENQVEFLTRVLRFLQTRLGLSVSR
jgi:dipeptidyl aminopeptidase/acylaminoacyl peptidase